MTREQLIAHLTLHGWVPIVNGVEERGIRNASTGTQLLAWQPRIYEHGTSIKVLKLTNANNRAFQTTITECTVTGWNGHEEYELEALAREAAKYE